MDDKAELLGRLRIDRSEPEARRGWLAPAAAAGLVLAGLAFWLLREPLPLIELSQAQALAGMPSAAAASVLDASGYVVARRQATVSAEITGRVSEVLIEEGMQVAEGQVLARLDDAAAQAQLGLAEAQEGAARAAREEIRALLGEARRRLRRTRELHAEGNLSEAALDAVRTEVTSLAAREARSAQELEVARRNVDLQREQLRKHVIRAPFAGVVTVKAAQSGEMISPISAGGGFTRTGVATLVDMDSLEIEVDVNENYINRVTPGQGVTARLNAYPDWRIPAEVIAVVPAADRTKATVKVRIALRESDARVLPDMGVRVAFLSAEDAATAPAGVSIPRAGLHEDGGTSVVYVLRDQQLERRAVRVGARQGDLVTVTAGLDGGERIALGAGDTPLADGLRVRLPE